MSTLPGSSERLGLLIQLAHNNVASNPSLGLVYAAEAEEIARQKKHPAQLSDALKLKADALFYMDSLYVALEAYLASAEVDQSSSRPRKDSILRRLGDAGYVYWRLGMFNKAIEYHHQALNMSEQIQDTAEIATNLSNLGLSYKMTGEHDKAIDCMLRALEIDRLTGNDTHLSTSYNSIGKVYYDWGKYDKALEFLKMALEIDIFNGDESKKSVRLSNLSQVYLATGRYEDAVKVLDEALEIDRRLNNPQRIATRLHGLGSAYKALGRFDLSNEYFEEAGTILRSIDLDFKLAAFLVDFGSLKQEMGELNEAEQMFLESFNLAKKSNLRPAKLSSAAGLYDIYKKKGRFGEALRYFEIYKANQDSVFNEESARLISEFEVKFETDKKIKENELLIKENEMRRRNQRLFLAVAFVLFLLAATFLWALVLKRKSLTQSRKLFESKAELTKFKMDAVEKQNLFLKEALFAEEEIKNLQAQSLEQKKQELTSATMLIASKNELLEKLRKLAQEIKVNIHAGPVDEAKEMIAEIEKQSDLGQQWETFKIHFESVHHNFFTILRSNNPCLTQNDMQLCAYMKLNLSTKEISRLMNISPESVNTQRYRLRKKLKLSSEEPLDDFIHKI